jgi:hypothetical protein
MRIRRSVPPGNVKMLILREDNRLCKQEIMKLRNKHKKDIFVLTGDFSLPDINWSEQTISSNKYTVGTNQTYLAIASANGLISRFLLRLASLRCSPFLAIIITPP